MALRISMPVLNAKTRFGPFELDSRSGELRTNGTRVKLQGQPISVLQILLETPGELVTREQIRGRLWSSDTFVDFDQSLNSAIKKLRQALGDEAETSRYIETIPRYGYRFIGQVVKDATLEPVASQPGQTEAERANAEPQPAPRSASRLRRVAPWALGAIAVGCAAIGGYFLHQPRPQGAVVRFTVSLPEGTELLGGSGMSLSPDGHTLAFVASPGSMLPQAIWVRPLDGLAAHQIPGTEGALGPFWSPDSQQIVFMQNGKLKKSP
jgi:DNA-binding winged helix-turn-helix (wHTH) protein